MTYHHSSFEFRVISQFEISFLTILAEFFTAYLVFRGVIRRTINQIKLLWRPKIQCWVVQLGTALVLIALLALSIIIPFADGAQLANYEEFSGFGRLVATRDTYHWLGGARVRSTREWLTDMLWPGAWCQFVVLVERYFIYNVAHGKKNCWSFIFLI